MASFTQKCFAGAQQISLVCLDNVFDCPPADGAAGVGHLLEFQSAGVAQTHMSTGVQHSVHHVLIADGALIAPCVRRESGRLRQAGERGVWSCTCGGGEGRVVVGVEA